MCGLTVPRVKGLGGVGDFVTTRLRRTFTSSNCCEQLFTVSLPQHLNKTKQLLGYEQTNRKQATRGWLACVFVVGEGVVPLARPIIFSIT